MTKSEKKLKNIPKAVQTHVFEMYTCQLNCCPGWNKISFLFLFCFQKKIPKIFHCQKGKILEKENQQTQYFVLFLGFWKVKSTTRNEKVPVSQV